MESQSELPKMPALMLMTRPQSLSGQESELASSLEGGDYDLPICCDAEHICLGSTDSISMCLHGSTDPVTAALHIVLGDSMLVDAVAIHSAQRLERFAMTMVSYGYFGDLMAHSEK